MRKALGPAYFAGKRMSWGKGVVAGGTFFFPSGGSGRDRHTDTCPEGMAEQVENTWDDIRHNLEEAGTSVENIVMRLTFVTDIGEWHKAGRPAQEAWLAEHAPGQIENPPASSLFGITALALPEMKVEIQVIAAMPD
jgi:enamine deaminase RidA (YjgF/YER057c/UK114 family)